MLYTGKTNRIFVAKHSKRKLESLGCEDIQTWPHSRAKTWSLVYHGDQNTRMRAGAVIRQMGWERNNRETHYFSRFNINYQP